MDLVEANPNDKELTSKLFECKCGSHFIKFLKWENEDMLHIELFQNANEVQIDSIANVDNFDLYLSKDQALELSETLRDAFNVKTISDTHDHWPTECG
tara:strand:- start:1445 stop:1738 length:294 start_codon:yes stop_codon:yes gene_type:complete